MCSVGIVIVKNQKVSNTFYELIHPAPNYYCDWGTEIHGLIHRDTDQADPLPVIWREIAPALTGLSLVAHNSPFDESYLRSIFGYYGISYPDYKFSCACDNRAKHSELPDHRLDTAAEHIEFDLKDHHHVLTDALTCAEIAKAICRTPNK